MNEKYKSTSPSATQIKKKKKTIGTEERVHVMNQLAKR
jgi:hypothetical protein